MSDKTSIQWTDSTWNPTRGCTRVSEGCRNCYAERQAGRFTMPGQAYHGFVEQNRWTGRVELIESQLDLPLRWKQPRRIFVDSMSDLFHEALPDEAIDRVFGVMALAARHTFQVLTKRPTRMRAWFARERARTAPVECLAEMYVYRPDLAGRFSFDKEAAYGVGLRGWPLPHVWLGVSVEDQTTANERIPLLLATPAALRFVSYEPALGPLNLVSMSYDSGHRLPEALRVNDERCSLDALRGVSTWPTCHYRSPTIPGHNRIIDGELFQSAGDARHIDWLIVGGESGPSARPFDLAWARSVIGQCRAAGVPCFVKQLGSRPDGWWTNQNGPCVNRHSIKDSKGGDWSEWPDNLRVREFPR